ncbi:flagellar biosynthesis anti-sigma factor FlgM [Peredibacter starrii]|uniref:Negative regulator of flagellin synthesis n=1 Tax=Peredibacter starrii TaxID=28202 RepID=A0AAX4HPP4_9BACT|nr:flagellar biosynthesis anti-sigma factor FlgM [Peredibacter starrii]WPU65293.1 flagellar biosynthesis anti-sigma factor FlgM [Peredibacter starrii]
MSSIDTRSAFFPRSRSAQAESTKQSGKVDAPQRNSMERATELTEKTATDAKVNIGDGVKDFARIKKAAMSAPETDNSEKIARLKAQIAAGSYEIDYDGLADKILTSEF